MGEVIVLAEERERRRVAFGPADWARAAMICFLPTCLCMLVAQCALDALRRIGERS